VHSEQSLDCVNVSVDIISEAPQFVSRGKFVKGVVTAEIQAEQEARIEAEIEPTDSEDDERAMHDNINGHIKASLQSVEHPHGATNASSAHDQPDERAVIFSATKVWY
jgi:hypothetical protein